MPGLTPVKKKRIVQGYDLFLFFLLQQILTLTEAEWQEMAASHNILLKQRQTTILMNEQKVNQEFKPENHISARQSGR